jgi:hypothetical protein
MSRLLRRYRSITAFAVPSISTGARCPASTPASERNPAGFAPGAVTGMPNCRRQPSSTHSDSSGVKAGSSVKEKSLRPSMKRARSGRKPRSSSFSKSTRSCEE